MIDRGDIRQAIDRCSNISFTAGAGYGQFEHMFTSPRKQRSGRNGQRD